MEISTPITAKLAVDLLQIFFCGAKSAINPYQLLRIFQCGFYPAGVNSHAPVQLQKSLQLKICYIHLNGVVLAASTCIGTNTCQLQHHCVLLEPPPRPPPKLAETLSLLQPSSCGSYVKVRTVGNYDAYLITPIVMAAGIGGMHHSVCMYKSVLTTVMCSWGSAVMCISHDTGALHWGVTGCVVYVLKGWA